MRKPLIIGNWKMNLNHIQASELVNEVGKNLENIQANIIGSVDIVVCPSFTSLQAVSETIKKYPFLRLGAQDVSWERAGALTGEISVEMLKPFGVEYVIVGHSERRHILKESDELIASKIRLLVKEAIIPVLCVGETLDQRQQNRQRSIVASQIRDGLNSIDIRDIKNIVIAYEPVWAIGTGQNATVSDAEEMAGLIRKVLNSIAKGVANIVCVLYGGSVTPENIDSFMRSGNIDGALVGGASLNPDQFIEITKFKERLF